LPELLAPAARLTSRYAAVVVLGWIVVAAVGNLAVPQLERVAASHARSFMSTNAASAVAARQSAELFGDKPSNNLNYVVLERDRPLQQADRRYYDGWNEPAATPAGSESNRGSASMDCHFPANRLLPDVVTVEADHDLRNPAGLIAAERITRQIVAIPGVRMVQSAGRPAGTIPYEATLRYQAGLLGRQFGDDIDSLVQRLQRVGDLDAILSQVTVAVDQLGHGMQGSANGLRQIGSGADDMRAGIDGLRGNVDAVSGYLAPLRTFVDTTPDCRANPICSLVARVVEPVDSVVRSSGELSSGAIKLTSGSSTATTAFAGLPPALESMRDVLGQAESATRDLRGATDSIAPQVRQLSSYLQEIDAGFRDSGAGGFYLPARALSDSRHREVLNDLVSRDGRVTYLLVYGDGQEWGATARSAPDRSRPRSARQPRRGP
jgi:putative drug exporter of the RND superfamily